MKAPKNSRQTRVDECVLWGMDDDSHQPQQGAAGAPSHWSQFKFPGAKPDVGWCWPRGMLLLPWRQAKVLLKSITGDYCLLGTFWVSLVHLGTLKPLISVVRRWWVASCPKLYPPSCLMSLSAVLNIHVGLCYIITLFQHVCAVAGRAAMLTKIFAVWYATDKRSL